MTSLVLVADDLTGALDSAAAFSGRFGTIPVHLGVPHAQLGEHAAIDLATRDTDASTASRRAAAAAALLADADIAFKKIDSRLRGPWAVELAATLQAAAFRMCVMAPAFPAQGRMTVNGRQHVVAVDGWSSMEPVDPLHALRELGVQVVPVQVGELAACSNAVVQDVPGSVPVFLCDASTDEDLRAIVRDVSAHCGGPGGVLWCGAAGLAKALAPEETPPAMLPGVPVLAIVGTNHPVSREQAARAIAAGAAHHAIRPTALAEAEGFILRTFDSHRNMLLTFELEAAISAPQASQLIGACLSRLLASLPPPALLVATGGETLLSICRALDTSRLDVEGEAVPGIPHSRVSGGPWDGTRVLSKSGGFGSPEWLSEILRTSGS